MSGLHLCRDCRWRRWALFGFHLCRNHDVAPARLSMVSGVAKQEEVFCRSARAIDRSCGSDGKYWEAR